MVALLIIGLLASVAYPTYRDQVQKGRRSDAIAALGVLQLAQERHRSSSPTYADSVQALGRSAISEGGHYDLSVQNASGSTYTLIATARTDSAQSKDTACARMAIAQAAGATQYLAGGSVESLAVDTARRCWPR